MSKSTSGPDTVEDFIRRWQGVTASELSTSQSFISVLASKDLLESLLETSKPPLPPASRTRITC